MVWAGQAFHRFPGLSHCTGCPMLLRAKDGLRGRFRHRGTGEFVRYVRWYDEETGEYEAFRRNPDTGCREKYRGRAPLQFIPNPVATADATLTEAVPEDESQYPTRRVSARRLLKWLFEDRDCEHYGCIHKAEWRTADEVHLPPVEKLETIPPLLAADGTVLVPARQKLRRFERGKVVRSHYWCHQHYQRPGLVYPDGSVDPQELPGHCGRPN